MSALLDGLLIFAGVLIFPMLWLAGRTGTYTHRHRWRTTHTNRWQIPTRQECRCGLSREVSSDRQTIPELEHIGDGGWPDFTFRWLYSDGRKGRWRRMVDGQPVKPANTRSSDA